MNNFENHLNHFKTAQASQKPIHLASLNDTATSILEKIWPFLSKSDTAHAAGKAFARYRSLIENEKATISAMRSESNEAIESIRTAKADISDYRIILREGTDQNTSIKGDIEEKPSKIDEMLNSTKAFYQRLTQGDAKSASIENQFVQAQTSAIKDSSKIAERLSDVGRKLEELDRSYSELVGREEDSEEKQRGLKTQLEDRKRQLETMVDDFGKKFSGMVEQVEGLLPGATSAGLATTNSTLRATAEVRAWRYSVALSLPQRSGPPL